MANSFLLCVISSLLCPPAFPPPFNKPLVTCYPPKLARNKKLAVKLRKKTLQYHKTSEFCLCKNKYKHYLTLEICFTTYFQRLNKHWLMQEHDLGENLPIL